MTYTQRDFKLMKDLSSYGMLTAKQIAENYFQSIALTTVLRRLRILEERHVIKRILGLESFETLWFLTEKGASLADVPVAKRHWSKNLLEHDHQLTKLRLALEKSGIALSWIPEHQIRSATITKYGFKGAQKKLIPDGLMKANSHTSNMTVAIEVELTLKSQDRIKEIIARYHEKKDLQAVWYFSNNKALLSSIFLAWRKYMPKNKEITFHMSYLDEVLKDPYSAKIWTPDNLCPTTVSSIWPVYIAHPTDLGVSRRILSPNLLEQDLTVENDFGKVVIDHFKDCRLHH